MIKWDTPNSPLSFAHACTGALFQTDRSTHTHTLKNFGYLLFSSNFLFNSSHSKKPELYVKADNTVKYNKAQMTELLLYFFCTCCSITLVSLGDVKFLLFMFCLSLQFYPDSDLSVSAQGIYQIFSL